MSNQIPIDPTLPKNFDSTPNEERSKSQLDAWWDHPFAVKQDDGTLEVRCLNGGAWDRSTWLGNAATYDEACELADKKQSDWIICRAHPLIRIGESFDVVRMPQRPDHAETVLASFKTMEEVTSFFAKNYSNTK